MEHLTMKLLTSIPLRRDGTVRATGPDGREWVFRAVEGSDEAGCDVDDPAAVAALLATGNFYPADAADLEAALALVGSVAGDRDDEGDDEGDEDDEAAVAGSALPVEANTPPVPARARKGRAAR
jgi:hypothetical protein